MKQIFHQGLESVSDNDNYDIAAYPHSPVPDTSRSEIHNVSLTIDRKAVNTYCDTNDITDFAFFLTVTFQVLHRIMREDSLTIPTVFTVGSNPARLNAGERSVKSTISLLSHNCTSSFTVAAKEMMQQYADATSSCDHIAEQSEHKADIMFVFRLEQESAPAAEEKDIATKTAKMPLAIAFIPGGSEYIISLEYDSSLYCKEDMLSLSGAIRTFALNVISAGKENIAIKDIRLVSPDEEQVLIALGKGETVECDRSKTFVDLFREQAARTPDNIAVVFKEKSLTYRELDDKTNRLAAYLQKGYGIGHEDVVGVLVRRSELMAVYSIAVLKAGAAYMPLDNGLPAERLDFMTKDAGVRLILAEEDLLSRKLAEYEGPAFCPVLSELPSGVPDESSGPRPDNAFVVLYTSGSTGLPKGVILEHRNIVNHNRCYIAKSGLNENDRVAAFAAFGFDMHAFEFYTTLSTGATLYILDDDTRLDLQTLSQYLNDNSITVTFLTTQVGVLFMQTCKIPSLRLLTVAGEKLPSVDRPSYRLINGYGPTETTLYATMFELDGPYDRPIIGRPSYGYEMYVVDSSLHLVPKGIAGELVIAGEGVGRGYINRPEQMKHSFIKLGDLSDRIPGREGTRAYRTGDIVRWAEDGNLEFIGRNDGQLKISGHRIEPGEIENCTLGLEGIRQALVVARGNMLCLYYTSEGDIGEDTVREHLEAKLADYMVPNIFIHLDEMPLTPNGKINRRALPEPQIQEEENVLPSDEIEKKLFDTVKGILEHKRFGVTTNLLSLGMTSITAMRVSTVLAQEYSIILPTNVIISHPLIREWADELKDGYDASDACPCTIHPIQEYYPLTENQKGVYIDWDLHHNTTQYNIPSVMHFSGIDANILRSALLEVIDAHPHLKMQLVLVDGEVMQHRRDRHGIEVTVKEMESNPDAAFFQRRTRPFDLFNDDLCRFEIYTCRGESWLFLDIHHIIFDGTSFSVFNSDLHKAIAGEPIEAENYTAYDRAIDESRWSGTKAFGKAEKYFDKLLSDCEAASYPHSPVPDTRKPESRTVCVSVRAEKVNDYCQANTITDTAFFLTVASQVMHRVLRERGLMLPTLFHGRDNVVMQDITGMFVKTIPLVSRTGYGSFIDAARTMMQQYADSQKHSLYGYTRIVERTGLKSGIMLVPQLKDEDDVSDMALDTAKVPVMIFFIPRGDEYNITIEYDTSLYSKVDMSVLAEAIRTFALNVISAGEENIAIKDISLVSPDEEQSLIALGKGKTVEYDRSRTFVDLFREQAARTPDNIAVKQHLMGIGVEDIVGRPLPNYGLLILDSDLKPLPRGIAGELAVYGEGVARGYLNNEGLTTEKFVDCPFITNDDGTPAKMYLTGDLCRWSEDGHLKYIGRIDNQVKLRGFRIEPGEIESGAVRFEGIRQAVAQVKSGQLCLYYTSKADIDESAFKESLAQTLAEYMVPDIFIHLDQMPLTSNGKINRMALPEPHLKEEDMVLPTGELGKKLFDTVSEVLGHNHFGKTTNLIKSGLSSLSAMRISALLAHNFNISLPTRDILTHPAIVDWLKIIAEGKKDCPRTENNRKREQRNFYPMTETQRLLFIEWEKNRDTTQYNLPVIWKMNGCDIERYTKAICDVIDAHPVLKATFELKDGDYVMARHDDKPPVVEVVYTDSEPDKNMISSFIKPFNLDGGSLYRACLLADRSHETVHIILDIHHSVCDGLSLRILVQAIQDAYSGRKIQKENYTYFDHSEDESEMMASPSASDAERYFDNLLDGFEVTTYPQVEKAESKDGFAAESLEFDGKEIDAFCRRNGFTQANYFMTMFLHLLHEVTREDNILITTINNGRNAVLEYDTVGMFVKTLPVTSIRYPATTSVTDAVNTVQHQFQRTQSFDYYPFIKMAERHPVRSEILFEYQKGVFLDDILDQQKNKSLEVDNNMVKTPVTVSVAGGISDKGNYSLLVRYLPSMYTGQQMKTLLEMMRTVSMAAPLCSTMGELPLVTKEEEARIIAMSAGPIVDFDISSTFVKAFVRCAAIYPQRTAVVDEAGLHSYQQLNSASDLLAHKLIESGVRKDEFIALLLGRSWHFPLSVISVHKAGAAYVPLDPGYPAERIQYMLDNSESRVILTTRSDFEHICNAGMQFDQSRFKIVLLDDIDFSITAGPIDLSSPDGLAYMIYTSGSTGLPKGAVLHQAGLWNFIGSIRSLYHLTEDDRIASHRTFSFVAHVEDLYAILTVGGSLHIMPEAIRKDPDLIYEFLVSHDITGCGFTTSLARLMNDNYKLPARYLTAGGEKLYGIVSSGHPQVINVYGPTECTDHTSVFFLETGKTYDNIPIGRTLPNNWSFVTSPSGKLLPPGVPGELCFAGIQVAGGYWHLDDISDKVFTSCPYVVKDSWEREVRMYHTGDLVRWNGDEVLEHLGRIDCQAKVRGYRVEPGEIEAAAMAYDGISSAAVRIREIDGSNRICLYYTVSDSAAASTEQVRRFIENGKLAEYLHPDFYVVLDSMPLTPSGKIDRKSLPEPEIKTGEIMLPSTELEEKLFNTVTEILKHDGFGVTDNLLTVGLTSISAMRVSTMLSHKYGILLSTRDILSHPVIREWEKALSRGFTAADVCPCTIHPLQEYYPLTENQRGIYIDWELHRNTTQYNLTYVMRFSDINADILRSALLEVIDAHPHLKMQLSTVDDNVMQHRRDKHSIDVSIGVLTTAPDTSFFQSRVKPFDLFNDDLCHCEIYSFNKDTWLYFDIHHIIFDGTSFSVLRSDIWKAINGEQLDKEQYTAFDRSIDETQWSESEAFGRAEAYFDRLLSDCEAASYPQSSVPDTQEPRSRTVCVSVDAGAVNSFCHRNALTNTAFFLTSASQTIHRMLREDNLMFTTLFHGRDNTTVQDITGMFVKTMPLVSRIGNESFCDAARAMMEQYADSQEHALYGYTRTVERSDLRAKIMLVPQLEYNSVQDYEESMIEPDTAKLPLTLKFIPSTGKYDICLEYDSSLYCRNDMLSLAEAIRTFALNVISAGEENIAIKDASLVSPDEEQVLIALGKGEIQEYDRSRTFVDLFVEQAERTPDAVAVTDCEGSFTYNELNIASNALAHSLVEAGVKPDDFVCVMLPRRKEFVLAVLGIMKAGAAYVPIDLDYPEERKAFMFEDSEAKVLISPEWLDKHRSNDTSPVNLATPETLAYMIYTSGSTGKPKGAMIPQSNLTNYIHSTAKALSLSADDRISSHRSFSFDSHIEDLFPTLSVGGCLFIMPEEIRRDIPAIREFILSNNITGGGYNTSVAALLLSTYNDLPLRYISAIGERLDNVVCDSVQIVNAYGPTECTDHISLFFLEKGVSYKNIPIGKPVANNCCLITDAYGKLVPRGVAGELCIAGNQVGRGYWHHPELTAEKFVDCPFITNDKGTPAKMYRTGDLCRWSEDGQLEYIGRIDNQVKLRGFRIEPGEIESGAVRFEGIRQAIAQVKSGQLCLYYTSEADIDETAFKESLAKTLAEYMVPNIFIHLGEMPLTPNGKINRRALPEPVVKRTVEIVKPASPRERIVYGKVREILGTDDIGVTDDLFLYGLNSINAMRLINSLPKEWNLRISDILGAHTIRGLLYERHEIAWYYGSYHTDRQTAAVVGGVIGFRDLMPIITALSKKYNVIVFEHIHETIIAADDATQLVSADGYERFIQLYVSKLHSLIQPQASLSMLIGFSFGGRMAYSLASQWHSETGQKPAVILGDAQFQLFSDIDSVDRKFTQLKAAQWQEDLAVLHERMDLHELGIYRNALLEIICSDTDDSPVYDGKVLLLRAKNANPANEIIAGNLSRRAESSNSLISGAARLAYNLARWIYRLSGLHSLKSRNNSMKFGLLEKRHTEESMKNVERWQKHANGLQVVDIDDNHYGMNKLSSHITQYMDLIDSFMNNAGRIGQSSDND
ncbi:MAG: amino acid adenylation domain-containing protein [Bacteroidales bacterium]|nr:amino acid adenylation domain-containing protein [Candidatus Cacconaster merdequi]